MRSDTVAFPGEVGVEDRWGPFWHAFSSVYLSYLRGSIVVTRWYPTHDATYTPPSHMGMNAE
jgi:hypothetical protein